MFLHKVSEHRFTGCSFFAEFSPLRCLSLFHWNEEFHSKKTIKEKGAQIENNLILTGRMKGGGSFWHTNKPDRLTTKIEGC